MEEPVRILPQNIGPKSWPTGGTDRGAELDDPSDQFGRRNSFAPLTQTRDEAPEIPDPLRGRL